MRKLLIILFVIVKCVQSCAVVCYPIAGVTKLQLLISETCLWCLAISLLWGSTNPLIKQSTKEIVHIKNSNFLSKSFYEVAYLFQNVRYLLFLGINQGGSILYLILLQNADLSIIVPAVNALTFLVTAVVGIIAKENKPHPNTFCGLVLILFGITLCMLDKVSNESLQP